MSNYFTPRVVGSISKNLLQSNTQLTSSLRDTNQFTSIFARRKRVVPVRRALVAIGTIGPNQAEKNRIFAQELITIEVEKFKNKYQFDPEKFRPIETANPKYEWELVESDESKEMRQQLLSLPTSRNEERKSENSRVTQDENKNITESSQKLEDRISEKGIDSLESELPTPTITVSVAAKINTKSQQRLITDYAPVRKRSLMEDDDHTTQPTKKAKLIG